MRHFLAFVLTMASFSAFAQIMTSPYNGLCDLSFRSDSYGRGAESAFTGEDLRGKYHDESCYQLGFESAQKVIDQYGRQSCTRDFKQGYPEGFSASPYGAGVECYNLGYTAGRGALGTGAREGNREVVGDKCVDAYQLGRVDGKAGRVANPQTTDQPDLYCYQLGHFEHSLFN